MTKMLRKGGLVAAAALTAASLALVGCGGGDKASGDTAKKTATTKVPATTAAPTTTAPASTAAPAAPASMAYPEGSPVKIAVDKTEVSAGDTITAMASGFNPGASLASSFLSSWPPTDMPDADHMATYLPDIAVADPTGAATVQIKVDPVCGKGTCYVVVADGIGGKGIYAAAKLTFKG